MTSRSIFLFCFLFCITLLGGAAYLQYVEGLEPCSLCILQRWAVIGVCVVSFLALLHHPLAIGRKIYAISIIIIASAGAFLAGRQVWLQHLPPDAQPECGPGLNFLLDNFPITEALSYVFAGSGECAAVDWTFLGQSLAVWSFCAFVALMLAGLLVVLQRRV